MNNIQMYGMISHSINFKANKSKPVINAAKNVINSYTKSVMQATTAFMPGALALISPSINTNTVSSNYPKWITDIYNKVDKKKDGIITQDEIDNLDRAKEGIGTIYIFEDGMSIDDFVNRNRSVFSGYVHFEGDPIEGRQIIDPNGKLQRTNFTRKISFDSDKSIEVMQGEYSIIEYSENTPFMQTYGIGPCVAVTIYDKKSKKGFLAHIDTHSKAKSLNGILSRLKTRGFDTDNCEARIIGGQTGCSTETVKEIQKQLNSKKINIVEMDVLGSDARSIQLDLNTGEVTDYNETIHTRNDMDIVVVRTLYSENLIEYRPKI
jgi:chemotaxis receptor (MCP) glutamine deamidase CheD